MFRKGTGFTFLSFLLKPRCERLRIGVTAANNMTQETSADFKSGPTEKRNNLSG